MRRLLIDWLTHGSINYFRYEGERFSRGKNLSFCSRAKMLFFCIRKKSNWHTVLINDYNQVNSGYF